MLYKRARRFYDFSMRFFLSLPILVSSCFAFGFQNSEEGLNSQVDFLRQLVSVSSGTNDIDGVGKVQDILAQELKKIGFTIQELPSEDPKIKSKQWVATKLGKTQKFITFIGHADTVFEKLNHFEISADGKTIKGSGVGDDKGGLSVGLYALRDLIKQNPSLNYSLRFVMSPSEETGSVGYRELLRIFSKDSALILGLEPALENGAIVNARKGVRWYLIKVTGLEAHAGVNPEAGVNACQQLSYFVDKIMALSDFKSGNTISVGHIEGGKDKFNIVCGSAEAKIDFRFVDHQSRDRIHTKIEAILKKITVRSQKNKIDSKVDYQIITEVPPFAASVQSQSLIKRYQKIIQDIEGREVKAVLTGGAADLNYMSGGSGFMLDGLGPVGGGYHTIDEYIETSSLASRTEVLSRFLNAFDRDEFKK